MIPRLDEFDNSQLQHALDEIVAGILRLEGFEAVKHFIRYGTVALMLKDDYKTLSRYQNLCLWRTQLLNAISVVGIRENINSN